MSQFRKKPVVIEAITFAQLVQYGREAISINAPGMPWSFNYQGHAISHENDACYLIPTKEGTMNFTPDDMLITGVQGEIYPCKIDIFRATYDTVAQQSSDDATEQAIQAAGKTAPRVTPDSIKAAIVAEHYFTASDGVLGRLYAESEDGDIGDGAAPVALSLLTFCVLVLRNGFTVMGKSACASPENFDANIGRKIARDDAISQVWPLEGYLLKEALYVQAVTGQPAPAAAHAGDSTMPAHQQRVIDEHVALSGNAHRLGAFIVTATFQRLPDDEQVRLANQFDAMNKYASILAERIAAF